MSQLLFLSRTKWLVLCLLLALGQGCTGDEAPPAPPPNDSGQETAGPVFDEKRIHAALSGTDVQLSVALGNVADEAVAGSIRVTLKSLDGAELSQASQDFAYGAGGYTVEMTLPGLEDDTGRADAVKYVLDYEVTWSAGESIGRRSLFDALDKLEVIILTEDTIEVTRGGHFTLFVLDPATGKPVNNATVRLELKSESGESMAKAETETDEAGAASAELELEEGEEATSGATLVVTVEGNGAVETADVSIKIVRDQKILLTTDKPLYQPGQLIHLRALALHAGDKLPEAGQPLVFEVEDAKGNKLAKELVQTDAFGVASTKVLLANQINMGQWTLRATLGTTVSEKTITVERYTLPKFKTSMSLDQAWYAPGSKAVLTGEARYFFGKPVAGGQVHIVASTFDIEFTPFADVTTTTNEDGIFSVELDVPSYVVGLALEQGQGVLKVDVTVTDTAGQSFDATAAAPVAEGGVEVALVPESGSLALNLPNLVYVVTSDPLGNPLAAEVTISFEGETLVTLTTDDSGLGSFEMTPAETDTELEVTAKAGTESVVAKRTLSVDSDAATVLLRTAQSVYAVGDTVQIDVLVGETKDRVYLDMVHGGRTVDMRALEVSNGKAAHAFDLADGMQGDLLVSVFYVTNEGTLVRDQKLLFVAGAGDLNVSMTPKQAIYGPGDPASIELEVTDADGAPQVAAIGVQIVDEAVFALVQVQPGLLKVFFELAQELAVPRVWLKPGAFTPMGVIQQAGEIAGSAADSTQQQHAKVAFAALGDVAVHSVQKDTFKKSVADMHGALKPFVDAEKARLLADLNAMAQLGALTWENIGDFLEPELSGRMDFWNRPWTVVVDADTQRATLSSAGPDEREGTLDDVSLELNFQEIIYGAGFRDDWAMGEGDMDGFPGGAPNAGAGGSDLQTPTKDGGEAGVKVRQFFPETLYVNPSIITDANGKATIDLHVADSITEWRMTGLASTQSGLLGSGAGAMVVFQDFFVDIDFPVEITRNDAFSVPVALYNYLDEVQVVNLEVEAAPWVEITGPTSQTITLQPGQVVGASFDIRALNVGTHGLTVTAYGNAMSDAVKRTVRVRPDGKAFTFTKSSRFPTADDPALPAAAQITQEFVVPRSIPTA